MLSQSVEDQVSTSYGGPIEHYTRLVEEGTLNSDPHQKAVVEKLDKLQQTLRGYSNQPTSFFSKVMLVLKLTRVSCKSINWGVFQICGLVINLTWLD